MKLTPFTRSPIKAELYGLETYFREGLADATQVLGDGVTAALLKSALLVIKPEGLASGKATTIVDFVREHGFSIAAVELPRLSRFQWRELWRYQLGAATLDRLAVNDLILQDQALMLLLRHEGMLDVPATVWLASLKGPSDVSLQSPGCLRKLLAQPNRLFSFFHVSDEPADILREIAILLDVPARRRVLSTLAVSGRLSPVEQQLLDDTLAASDRAARPLDAQVSLERVEQAFRGISGAAAERVRANLASMRRGDRISWRPFAQAVGEAGVELDRWDLATLGASFIVYDEPGTSKLIAGVDIGLWR
jgi:nucleoside diphosphate kinase